MYEVDFVNATGALSALLSPERGPASGSVLFERVCIYTESLAFSRKSSNIPEQRQEESVGKMTRAFRIICMHRR